MTKTVIAALVLVGSGLALAPTADAVRPSVPVVRVDKQCRTGHNPNCHEVFVSQRVGDYYRPVGIWVKFAPPKK